MMSRLIRLFVLMLLFVPFMSAQAQWSSSPGMNNAICQAGNNQVGPRIISDGKDGAIICWYDERGSSNSFDIYAQRIDNAGFVRWTVNGNLVCGAPNSQIQPDIVSDDAGGAIIVWTDTRDGNNDIYAQRIDSSGAVLWTPDGIALTFDTSNQADPKVTGDGQHGAIVTWNANTGGFPPISKIYAQRIDAGGNLMWGSQVLVSGSLRFSNAPSIASDGNGGAYIAYAYYPRPEYDVYVQRLDANGAVQWDPKGIGVATGSGDQDSPMLFSDGAGHAFLTFADWAGSIANMQFVILKRDGTQAANFRPASTSGGQASPQMARIRPGVMGLVWEDGRSAGKKRVFAQIIDSTGAITYPADGVSVSNRTGDQVSPTVSTDGAGGLIVAFEDKTKGATQTDIYGQRISNSGTLQWTDPGIAICTADKIQQFPRMIPDGQGGAILTWEDYRPSFSNVEIYASRILADGSFPTSPAILSFSTKSVAFGSVGIGYSLTKNVTLTNTGGAPVTIASVTPSDARFTVTVDNMTLDPSGSATATLKFQPTSKEVLNAFVVFESNSVFAPDTVLVSGTGTGSASIRTDKTTLYFGNVKTGSSKPLALNISNLGNDTLRITSITTSNLAFKVDELTKDLLPGESFDDTVRFTPSAVGSVSANLTIISNASTSPTVVSLNGAGTPEVTLTIDLSDISFGAVPVGSYRDTTLTVTNTGNDTLWISSFTSGDSQFTLETPIAGIAPGSSATFTLRFTPQAAGQVSASFTMVSNAQSSPNTITVHGTGVADPAIAFAPEPLTFGSVEIGSKEDLVLTISNPGTLKLTVSSITSTNTDFAALQSQFEVAGGGSFANTIRFTPSVVGSLSGALIIESDAASSPDTVLVTGTGLDVNSVQRLQSVPGEFTLFQNYPNPFHPATTIRYDLHRAAPVRVTVYNALGQVASVLVDETQNPGSHAVQWMPSGNTPGIYLYVLRVGTHQAYGTMVLVK